MLTSIWSRLRWEERRNENAVISKTRYKLIVLCSEDTDVYLIPLKLEKWHQKWEICFHAVFNELAVWFCIVRTSEGDNALIFPVWSRPARIYWQHSFIFSQVEVCVCVCVRRHKSDLSGSALTRKKQGVFGSGTSDLRIVRVHQGNSDVNAGGQGHADLFCAGIKVDKRSISVSFLAVGPFKLKLHLRRRHLASACWSIRAPCRS